MGEGRKGSEGDRFRAEKLEKILVGKLTCGTCKSKIEQINKK